ncbi:TetR/AcrR family transcriptional regulator [Streptomyces phaeochromogenes]|uniref:TetR/AcrR family transcriptional regulator n=1 Tax=Streptomyces phaeochromogenes TaxID=1923 RepID=UPI0022574CD4|nr:TetR/AcrR family transcriptional regulator [Streptomyces phaeochromogenes]MCX5599319.1 TetR/AcrR family transcriptional regulator [Streptomyces phaeochromogenes]WRZ34901.1 TetR/AcrR family transcriptional regulator [Streptomyces phaeochromogenes]WSJ03195.1 TetR/AcrR family transcriptional regulator [Streptomyces phaeochromogenes]
MDRAKQRGPYAKTAARRADILRAARDSFAEHGYAGASLRDIAKRAGITHAGLLHHFQNKDEVLTAVLAQRDDEEWERSFTEADGQSSPRRYLAETLLQHQKTPELMRLWAELAASASRPGHPAHAYFVDRNERVRSYTAEAMRERAAEGRLPEGLDADSAAALFLAVLHGLQMQWLLNQDLDIIAPLNRFFDLILLPADGQNSTGTSA